MTVIIVVGVFFVGVLVSTFPEFERVNNADRLERWNPFALGALDHVKQPLLEGSTINDQCVSVVHDVDLLR